MEVCRAKTKVSPFWAFVLLAYTFLQVESLSSFFGRNGSGASGGCGRFVFWVRGGYYVDNSQLVEGGRELSSYGRGFPFYICRVSHNGDLYIGKFIKSERETEATPSQCWFSDGVKDHAHDKPADYEVLVDHSPVTGRKALDWETPAMYSDGEGAPLDAFWAGTNKEGRSLFIGQCTIDLESASSTTIPGTVAGGSSDTMNVAFNNESPSCQVDKYLTCLSYSLEK